MKKALLILLYVPLMFSCGENNEKEKEKSNQGWPYAEQKAFMENCILSFNNNSNGQDNAKDYCECALEKTISEYPTPDKALNMDMKFILKMAEECQ